MTYEALTDAAAEIARRSGRDEHHLAIVLGSGLGSYAAELDGATTIPYEDIPGFPLPRVEGHGGTLVSAPMGDHAALVFSGRVHAYEGWDMADIVFGVRTAVLSGARTVMLTNAAGGVGDGLEPGSLVLIRDHINFTGRNPLEGPNDDRLGPRFPDMSTVYPQELRDLARQMGDSVDVTLHEGVYAWFLGPSYESPAEVEMARRMGADTVGMSTVPEAIAARHMGAELIGISLVTNLAAGLSPEPLSHEEVTEVAAAARDRFTRLLDALLPALADR